MNNNTRLCSTMKSNSFWESVNILLKKPHIVNKRLWGALLLSDDFCKPLLSNWKLPLNCQRLKYTNDIEEYKIEIFETLKVQQCDESDADVLEVRVLELLPKTYSDSHAFQLIILQKEIPAATFFDITPEVLNQKLCPNFVYSFRLDCDEVVLDTECDTASKSYQWLQDIVLPQVVKWGDECGNEIEKQNVCNESLALVPHDKYYNKYNDLKMKYGKEMVQIWPECTDPSKFVYEDVAIATYLLLLWEDEKHDLCLSKKQTFVDLGCGNGLLVYILTKEGHHGIGLDVRKRQIWDIYTSDVRLQEKTITPSDVHLFPDTDWIIGNHSDELTPWIPVIAARSSYKCNFFLLPCCAFNFNGTKYRRKNSSKSQYTEYLEYIKQLCVDCGFRTDIDRLKIPSTKRICLIGRGRTYLEKEYDSYCSSIQEMINNGTTSKDHCNETSWIKDFKAREPVEKVRNCTQIDKTLIECIVDRISSYLLEGCCLESKWSAGKTVEISKVVQLIPQEKLKALKDECGGLQTIMKNNHHIFKVQGGTVQLRYPKTVDEVNNGCKNNTNKTNKLKIQQKPCWFYNNHPQGCPLMDMHCSFLHIKS